MKRTIIDLTGDSDNETEKGHDGDASTINTGISLTTVRELRKEENAECTSLSDLLTGVRVSNCNVSTKDILSMVQINYMLDIDFLMSNIKTNKKHEIPILVLHGMSEGQLPSPLIQRWKNTYSNVTMYKVPLPFEYGTHHTKAMIIFYTDYTLKLVIHTANIIPRDWGSKTQGVWTSPLLVIKTPSSPASQFETDFLEYISRYGSITKFLMSRLDKYDYSPCKVVLIPSVPGRHTGDALNKYGHMKLRSMLRSDKMPLSPNDYFITQASSIGSLGPKVESWIAGELLDSFKGGSTPRSADKLHLIFPSVENVRNSFEGYAAGDSIPFDKKSWEKQRQYMMKVLCTWQAACSRRSRAMPHIKTYTRVSEEKHLRWFLLTSANISKAAMGGLEKNKTQLMIRNYELGVLIMPHLLGVENLVPLNQVATLKNSASIPVPYDLPPTPYRQDEDAWTWNSAHSAPDMFGNTWPML